MKTTGIDTAWRARLLTIILLVGLPSRVMGQSSDIEVPVPVTEDSSPAGPAAVMLECGTVVAPEDVPVAAYLRAIGAYEVAAAPEYVLSAPLTVHVVRMTNGTGGMTQTEVDSTIATANGHWEGAGIQFTQPGSTLFIDSDDFFLNIDTQAEINQLRQTDVVPDTINVYFTPNLAVEDGNDPDNLPDSLCGQSSFTWGSIQGITMNNGCTAADSPPNTSTFAHELGHYFDLFHTHETGNGVECPSGSNCASAGDQVCDTAADPQLNEPGMLSGCTYVGSAMACGQSYNPDPTNLMSYGGDCRTQFSGGQNNRALATLVNLRSNLVGGQLNVTWVDFGFGGSENGSFNQPFNDLAAALNATGPGGRIVMKPGATGATTIISSPVILDSFRGTARVGAQ